MSSHPPLGPFIIGERVGTSVWLAEDTRNGKRVAIKLLTRQLPKEQSKRDALVREVRISAALYHAFLVPILEIAPVGDNLLLVMEVVDGQSIARKLRSQPVERLEFFRIAYQLASVVKYLHMKDILHGNITGDSVMITPDGQIKLGGLNVNNLLKRDRGSTAYQQKGSDVRSVAYMAPEQITGQHVDQKSDVFQIGTVLYEVATGRQPFNGRTAADIARAVVEGNPPSPKAVNPNIAPAVLNLLGGCLFKDPFQRHRDAKAIVELIEKSDGEAAVFAHGLEKRIKTAMDVASETRRSILFIAEVVSDDPAASARMQQVLGEAVYLFDGTVVDPFGARLVAELPSVDSALEAGRKGEFDFSPVRGEEEPLPVRMLLHAGELELRDGMPAGPAVAKAFETLAQLPPNTLFITEEFVKEGRGNVRLRDAGAKAGVKLFTIVAPEPAAPTISEPEPEPTTAELAEEEAAAVQTELLFAKAQNTRRRLIFSAAGLLALAVLIGVAAMWSRRERPAPVAVATKTAPAAPAAPTAENPRKIYLAPFTLEAPDPLIIERANAIRLAAMAILRTFPELRVVDTPAPDAASFAAKVRAGAAGPELVVTAGAKTSAPAALVDSANGIRTVVQTVVDEVHARPRNIAAADALNSFADAVVAQSRNDAPRADSSLRASLASDPKFLPAQLLAMEVFRNGDALAAAKQVIALDPGNLEAARRVARASLAEGNLQQAFSFYDLILDRNRDDAEALNHVARYALSAGDTQAFNAALARLKRVPQQQVEAHEPDALAAAGRIDVAVQRYYALEETSPDNAALSLKIGRFSVLRHSLPIAELELKKLASSDPLYGQRMLNAYIAAEQQKRADAMKELQGALAASMAGDDAWTSAAEVHAILADTDGVLDALEKAAARKEPTAAYVLAHPLFRYLESEPRFQKIKKSLIEQQAEIRAALAPLR
jgi:tetratricopeptide (TPR) repeat protein